jgi:histone deacetylase 1/2
MNYFETYAPVVTWFAIRLMLVMAIYSTLALRQVDFVQAYPQAPIEFDMYMDLPQGIETCHGNSKDHVLKLLSNIYGQKQVGRVWNGYLVEKLRDIGFEQSLIDECVFYRGDVIFIVYVDDGIFVGPDDNEITQVIREIQGTGLDIEDQGHPADYIGVSIKKHKTGYYEMTQRALTDSIISDCELKDAYTKPVPAKTSQQLHAYKSSKLFSECNFPFNYRSVTGKLNYLAQTTRPDIIFSVHQIAKYSSDPRLEHGEAIVYLVRYLKKTRDLGLKFKPDPSKGFECYCDADFSGNWNKDFASHDPSTAKSRAGWVIYYAACPIIWASKIESQVALSMTESEYLSMSMSLRDVIPIMELLEEMRERKHQVICTKPIVYCKVFEYNSGALELARLPKLRPRTKHINVCYHHFREHVRLGLIKILPVSTDDQIADIFTKPLAQNTFCRHRFFLCGV